MGEALDLLYEGELCFNGVHVTGQLIEGYDIIPIKEVLVSPRVKMLDLYSLIILIIYTPHAS